MRFDRTTDEYSVFYHIYRGFNSNNNNKKKNLRRSSGFCVIIRCIIIIGAHIHIELIITAAVAMIIGSLFLFHIISTDFFLFHCNSVINIYVSKKIKKKLYAIAEMIIHRNEIAIHLFIRCCIIQIYSFYS